MEDFAMWFGKIVPLFRFPLIDGPKDAVPEVAEDRTLPLPPDLCVGMNTDHGTALYVTFGVNPDHRRLDKKGKNKAHWGDDLAGWMVIAPFPPSTVFESGQLMRIGIHLNNEAGAFYNGITKKVTSEGGAFLYMEVLGTGDVGSLVLLPPDKNPENVRENFRTIDDHTLAFEERSLNRRKDPLQLGWISSLFPPPRRANVSKLEKITWHPDRRVLVRDRQIAVPFGELWYNYNKMRQRAYEDDQKSGEEDSRELYHMPYKSNYCLLARDMELPVLLALFPSRPLYKVDLDVWAEADFISGSDSAQVGRGLLDRIVKELSDQKSNIWHVQNTFRSLVFDPQDGGLGASRKKPKAVLRGIDSRISIVASVPDTYQFDRPEDVRQYLKRLRGRLFSLSRPPGDDALKASLDDLPKMVALAIETASKEKVAEALKNFDEKGFDARYHRMLNKIVDGCMSDLLKRLGLSFVKNVDIHGPPLFRCFFSHSAGPDHEERGYIDRLKVLLESEVFEVIEGEFSLGMSTEELSRGQIRRCDLFVSFLWPRESFRSKDGEFKTPEWIAHEESFAIGQGTPVYRVREESVSGPLYERDRKEFAFVRGDLDNWKSLEHKFRSEVRQFVQRRLLEMPSTLQGSTKDRI
jgi:hypothetical protein